jgi:hypothetical protein
MEQFPSPAQVLPHCAEVLESSLTLWHAASVDIYRYPGFGSLLTIPSEAGKLYALVSGVTVASADAVHTPIPMGLLREELALLHPESRVHTRVTLACSAVGYQLQQSVILYQLPAHPPALHALVYEATDAEYCQFFLTEQYVPMIMYHQAAGAFRDELLLAIVAQRQRRMPLSAPQLEQFVAAVAPFFASDYSRFRQLLQRVERICDTLLQCTK